MGQALQFRVAMDQPIGARTVAEYDMQKKLIIEEFMEFNEAYDEMVKFKDPQSRAHALKEMADLCYVLFQFAACAGMELDVALDRVHQSNMSKLVDGKPVKNDIGKVVKGPNYKKPYLEDLV